ncbi:TetR/AcrR family transcriptional regulator [Caenibius sp. WL]|uniref:TetR/AcrR family transcriptional regulator n=1 Tax=Caenibius sp. WL TaxID=2872646 RepID=UPI001C991D4C|nr:TetR/AcrR family transcriptional regulator [Caenibius sp. WL]QZP08153.1 TetR/AcrR family transcriptional regulator [Caenibius sp. WL]
MENNAAKRQSTGAAKPRGRPARISRDMILDAAAALAEANPDELPSLNGIARALKISPMAIYTYFASKDELLQALSDRLLADFTLDIAPDTEPLDAVIRWAQAMRAHMLACPQLINVLVWEGGHTSIAWLERGMVVSEALGRMGFSGEAHARATLWVWHVAMGAINVELRNRDVPQNLTPQELASLDPVTRGQVEQMLSLTSLPVFAEEFFAYQLDRMCEGLRAMQRNMAAAQR